MFFLSHLPIFLFSCSFEIFFFLSRDSHRHAPFADEPYSTAALPELCRCHRARALLLPSYLSSSFINSMFLGKTNICRTYSGEGLLRRCRKWLSLSAIHFNFSPLLNTCHVWYSAEWAS